MINPLAAVARAAAILPISAGLLLDLHRTSAREVADLFGRLSDDFYARIEERCHARWTSLFDRGDALDEVA